MGRRKSWMVPCQYLIGIFMLLLSYKVSEIMGDDGSGKLVCYAFKVGIVQKEKLEKLSLLDSTFLTLYNCLYYE